MATEIERKWVAGELPAGLELGEQARLRQGYVAVDGDVAVRVRVSGGGAVLTVKAGGDGRSRTEVEVPISLADAEELWAHTAGRRLEKARYRVPLADAGVVAEVDVFAGDLDGLVLVEVEFASDADADAFTAPPWFGTEVTGRPEWTNAALAEHGPPPAS